MRGEHIIDLLDRTRLAGLSEDELSRVEAHALGCAACLRAYEAARVSAGLLAARARTDVEPPPFFQTRVMAALGERRAVREERSFARLWRPARMLVSAMAATVVLLAGAAYVTAPPDQPTVPRDVVVVDTLYSPEWDAFAQTGSTPADLSDDQLVAIMYESEDEYGPGR